MPEAHNSTLRAQAQNEGHCGASDNGRRRSKLRRSRCVAETKPRRDQSCEHFKRLVITRIVCIGTYSILCDFGAYTSFYAYTGI